MSNQKVLHVMPSTSRNTTRLMSFMSDMTFTRKQSFLVHGPMTDRVKFSESRFDVTFVKGDLLSFLKEARRFFESEKIVVHGFFNVNLKVFFLLFPSLLKKVYWVVWGGDLYSMLSLPRGFFGDVKSRISKFVFNKINFVVTYIPGDYLLVNKHFNPKSEFVKCLMYPGNLYKNNEVESSGQNSEARILVGNSGAPSNNHIRVFERLKRNPNSANIKIYCPLSYGNSEYISKVKRAGYQNFGDRFVALDKYMDMEHYVEFLSTIRYAVFDYDRQQGMGNIISLLGLGKGVFLNPSTTPWDFFKEEGVQVLDVNELVKADFEKEFVSDNPSKIKSKFSAEVLRKQLYEIFD
ncbi:MAG: TDP-N-acetylfucosamine:lipid II N-acetylfucosaminyltransferase [Marinobacter sp.]|uniref:TDP-N-acetylfucosamine:lipid II N-acetylfucosaminyltransferase n=1 Tax=Marinobacter sp. TaxID=50741 RepID=UPI003296B1FF